MGFSSTRVRGGARNQRLRHHHKEVADAAAHFGDTATSAEAETDRRIPHGCRYVAAGVMRVLRGVLRHPLFVRQQILQVLADTAPLGFVCEDTLRESGIAPSGVPRKFVLLFERRCTVPFGEDLLDDPDGFEMALALVLAPANSISAACSGVNR